MQRCLVCDGEEFEIQDGLYYCTMCQTQSQDLLEQEHSDGEFETQSTCSTTAKRRYRIHAKRAKSKKKLFGNSWTTYDAYNVILLNQVEALISLGASRELKVVVLNLWTRYLEKNCVAYLKKKKSSKCLSFYSRLRDIEVVVGQCSELASKQRIHKSATRIKQQRTNSTSTNPKCESVVSDFDERYNSESDTTTEHGFLSDGTVVISDSSVVISDADTNYDSDSSVKMSRKISSIEKKMKHLNRWALGRSIQRMNLSLTLSFLYLGLLLLQEQILLSDILRWAWEDKIPLYNTVDSLRDDMKFQLFDNQTFRLQHAISHERVRSDAGHLAKYLDISKIVCPSLEHIAARFIKELCLPDVMVCMISNLISTYPTNTLWESDRRSKVVIPNYEGITVAYIIVALKLLFGLNGDSEWIISNYSKVLREKQTLGDILLFDFHEWRKHTSIKYWLSSLNWRRSIRAKVTTQSVDLDELIRFYLETGCKWRGKLCMDRTLKQNAEAKVQSRYEGICNVFKTLTNAPLLQRATQATSFPLNSEAKEVLAKCSKFNSKTSYSLEIPNFGRASLKFLLKSPACSVNDGENSVNKWKKNKKRLKKIRKPYSKWLKAYKKYHLVNLSARTMSMLKFYSFPLLSSTTWLINLLAYVSEMKPESIYQEVSLLEKSVFKAKPIKRKKKRC